VNQEDGEVRLSLGDAVAVPFERVPPVRSFPAYKGQRNYPGFYYAATLDAHIVFESWMERDAAMAMDFDGDVVGFAAQPFWLSWSETDRARSHAPNGAEVDIFQPAWVDTTPDAWTVLTLTAVMG
jgi:hypothetical protein